MQSLPQKVRFGLYIISSLLENGGEQQYSGSLDNAISTESDQGIKMRETIRDGLS